MKRGGRFSPNPGLAIQALLAFLLMQACTSTGVPRRGLTGQIERGLASWYGPGFDGRPTASGEIYDRHDLTAAHRILPFGTVVEVRNRENGRSVRVRINDRGPFIRGRIIDLSYAAARELEMIVPGTAAVEIRVLSTRSVELAGGSYWVQAGAFKDEQRARALYSRLKSHYSNIRLLSDGSWHRVRIGPFSNRKAAERTQRRLESQGFDTFLTATA